MIKTTAVYPLRLSYMGVFATPHDCNTIAAPVPPVQATIPATGSYTYLLDPNLDASCAPITEVVLSGTANLPAFMSFNATTKILTVTPGPTDFGTFILDVSVKTIYDGMAPSLKVNSYVLTIYKPEIGSGTIPNQT